MSDTMDKRGRGHGDWTRRGRQALQQAQIDENAAENAELKALVEEMAARLEELEGGNDGGDTTGDETPEMPPA